MRSVELFAGAGGLALGCELAGFHPELVAEWDRWACDTVRENQSAGYPLVSGWNIHEGDVRDIDWGLISGPVDLVTGGPPCQPFSMGGKHRAAADRRDMFPAAIEVIRSLRPRAFILENVRGLTRPTFANYYQYILLQLTHPQISSRPDESWYDHFQRLQSEHTAAASEDLTYRVIPTLVNAADFGVPQQRHRVFIVGFRMDVDAEWRFPKPTHSYESLLYSQWVTGAYWERHGLASNERPSISPRSASRVGQLRHVPPEAVGRPWRTVRDAIGDLPDPTLSGGSDYPNHVLQPGARSYAGHTGSPADLPAKTLKAGGHGVPGGENMLLNVNGSIRYFSVRESARLQTFPDRYELHGAWGEAMRQLGNAVPVLLAQKVAGSVAEHLALADFRTKAQARSWSGEGRPATA